MLEIGIVMSIHNKQNAIVSELEQRIADGIYPEKLPRALDLAEEFDVNFKTLNKAIHQLVESGLVYRKPGLGTFIAQTRTRLEDSLVELLFVGSAEMSVHPFYSEMWRGVLDSLNNTGYKLVLTMLEEDPERGGLKNECRDFTPSAGKILIGTSDTEQIKRLKREKVPFILTGSKSSLPDVTAVYADSSKAIEDAVDYMRKNGIDNIAFIGMTRCENDEHLLELDKFHAYLSAVQKQGKLDSDLIEHAPPLPGFGETAMRAILKRKTPQAVIVAYDHLVPGVYNVINEAGLAIPNDISVLGIDGISMNITPTLTSIPIDRYAIGLKAGSLLLEQLRTPGRRNSGSCVLQAEFDPGFGQSIISS